ncbi:glycosyltransferase [Candidatus Parcubacteria bacterium]|nr:glycosyltransferase [Candidatus Parcubacteria bacterium]
MSNKLTIGFITYGKSTSKYLPFFLPSLKNALDEIHDYKIIVQDNTDKEENENKKYIKENYPEIDFEWSGKNIGFARAYNKLIKKAEKLDSEYFLVINPDVLLDKNAILKMIEALEDNDNLGSVAPKILKWDFENNKKTNIIDSCGIKLLPGLRFVDLGQCEIDNNQFENEKIIGPSGACALIKIDALIKIKKNEQYFDENMFMYKEDCDLIYRLYLANYNSAFVNDAVIYHDRTVTGKGEGIWNIIKSRKYKNKQEKKWSFVNQQLIYYKFWNTINLKNKLILIWHQAKSFIFILLFEQYLLLELPKLWYMKKKIIFYKKC